MTLGLAIALLDRLRPGDGGLQQHVDVAWISGLGVRYSLGLDGLNVFLMLLTAVALAAGDRLRGAARAGAAAASSS